jgi:hypothetical protein
MTDRHEKPEDPYKARLEAMATSGSPIGEWYKGCLDAEALLGDRATKAANAFVIAGFKAFIDLCDNPETLKRFDALIDDIQKASGFLEFHIINPAYEAFSQFYADNFGDPKEFEVAFFSFHGEVGTFEIRSMLTQTCYEQRLFEISVSSE